MACNTNQNGNALRTFLTVSVEAVNFFLFERASGLFDSLSDNPNSYIKQSADRFDISSSPCSIRRSVSQIFISAVHNEDLVHGLSIAIESSRGSDQQSQNNLFNNISSSPSSPSRINHHHPRKLQSRTRQGLHHRTRSRRRIDASTVVPHFCGEHGNRV
jgi:hypothetical protein